MIVAVQLGLAQGVLADDAAAGDLLYRTGARLDGSAPAARLADGSAVDGRQLPCADCHRGSGLGSSEGGVTTPPITWSALARSRDEDQRAPYRSRARTGQARAAYDAASFARALRDGVDPAGRVLDSPMPRYALGDEDVAALVAYLKTLSRDAPGVTEEAIHLATIIGPDVTPADASAIEDVLRVFAKTKNAESRNESGRARRGAYYQDTLNESFRRWIVHTWRLAGPPDSWQEQLEAYIAKQPVFAVVGGDAGARWDVVDVFCREQRLPCVLPQAAAVPAETDDGYTIWLTGGFALEANLLADHLDASGRASGATPRIALVHDESDRGAVHAEVFRMGLARRGYSDVVASSVSPESPADVLVTLLDEASTLAWLDAGRDPRETVYVSGIAYGSDLVTTLPARERTYLLHPYARRERVGPATRRATVWLERRGFAPPHRRVHLDAYLAALVTGDALKHMRTNFSRDYFVERIEHGLENLVYRSVYERLSLGPGQRIAAKSGTVIDLGRTASDRR